MEVMGVFQFMGRVAEKIPAVSFFSFSRRSICSLISAAIFMVVCEITFNSLYLYCRKVKLGFSPRTFTISLEISFRGVVMVLVNRTAIITLITKAIPVPKQKRKYQYHVIQHIGIRYGHDRIT